MHPLAEVHPKLRAVIRFALVIVWSFVVVFAFCAVFVLPSTEWTRGWVLNGFTFGALGLTALRFVLISRERWTWLFIGLSVASNAIGDAAWNLLGAPTSSSWADVVYLMYYPLMYVGLLQLVRHRTRDRSLAPWLDGVTTSITIVAVVSIVVFRHLVLSDQGTSTLTLMIRFVYPIGDLLLVALVISAMARRRWKPDIALLFAASSVVASAVADTIYLLGLGENGGGARGTELLWLGSVVVIAQAGWTQLPRVSARTAIMQTRVSILPLVSAGVAISILGFDHWVPLPTPSIVGAVCALLCAVARMLFAHRDLRLMGITQREARTDELTSLANRRSFMEHLDESTQTGSVGLLLLDLDGFKEVNDSLGHLAGDALLTEVASRLAQEASIGHGTIARLGGDEFAFLYPAATVDQCRTFADAVHAALDAPVFVEGLTVRVSTSVGIAVMPDHADSITELLRCADVAMYEAKRKRLRTSTYDAEADPNSRVQLATRDDLFQAVENDELIFYYQPKVVLADRRVEGFEALIRWNHPTRGILHPAEFLELAERANLMPRITRSAISKVIQDAKSWSLVEGYPHSVSVNITAGDLLDEGFPVFVSRMLERHDFPARRLIIEITEETLIADRQRAQRAVARLRALGIRISLDDFGMGFSSLSHLASLTIDELKLDRSIAIEVIDDARARAIVEATVGLARGLDMSLAVEGIETEATCERLAKLGCRVGQGFLFAEPMPSAEVNSWLKNQKNQSSKHRAVAMLAL